ncbi:RnfABCDGE type electron transport complex subunit D [Spirochaeta africana]|uniref:Ion-translocating oxidoreductase complex subunit D n=1 Tax=Spirochaeta africana (strain ATCC 700263 / DSM 8902 / Z-7692) TaxID=889378 RepID=H9UGJ1_SPIAZ|nr:RnfABCDGE type electron transport complex subunit D [Spirochaeta africana]AFG36634.1 electron transport complex, RnfABCDGE type, D subunit [Spirochaeta africana DSM 8902]
MSSPRIVAPSPHIHAGTSTRTLMWWVNLALLPLVITSVAVFGLRSLVVILTAVAACMLTEYILARFVLKKQVLVEDGSAIVTGILLAANLPVTIPFYQVILGSVVAIGIGKMAFGGIGHNPFNPALVGRTFLLVSYPVEMTTWSPPGFRLWTTMSDVVSTATPLGVVAEGPATEIFSNLPGYWELFWGNVGGTLGGVGVFAMLIGAVILLAKRIIDWQTPAAFLGGLILITGIAWLADPGEFINPLYHVLAGGAMLGAVFMVTDYTTSPMTMAGRMVFAGGAGVLTAVIRLFAALPDGVAYAILVMNALVPLIDRGFPPRRFGKPWTPPEPAAAGSTQQERAHV